MIKKHGYGKHTYNELLVYERQIKNNKYSALGTFYKYDRTPWTGQWIDDIPQPNKNDLSIHPLILEANTQSKCTSTLNLNGRECMQIMYYADEKYYCFSCWKGDDASAIKTFADCVCCG